MPREKRLDIKGRIKNFARKLRGEPPEETLEERIERKVREELDKPSGGFANRLRASLDPKPEAKKPSFTITEAELELKRLEAREREHAKALQEQKERWTTRKTSKAKAEGKSLAERLRGK